MSIINVVFLGVKMLHAIIKHWQIYYTSYQTQMFPEKQIDTAYICMYVYIYIYIL
jgi:hypothetical protein